jgi:RimJ/RimL family protein N-acetyltransferase
MLYLTTDRLLIRDFIEPDWQAVYDYTSNREAMRYRLSGVKTQEQTKAFIRHAIAQSQQNPRQTYDLAIVLKESDRVVGECELYLENFHHAINFDDSQARIGYAIAPQYWGKGYATEAVKRLLGFGFEKLDLHRIYAPCTPANLASARVLEKVGMRREGHFRESLWMQGKWVDVWLYAILDREWKNLA